MTPVLSAVLGGGTIGITLLLLYLFIHYIKKDQKLSDEESTDKEILSLNEASEKKDTSILKDIIIERNTINGMLLQKDDRIPTNSPKSMP